MFDSLKAKYGTSISELMTCLTIIATLLAITYKASLMYFLNIEWHLSLFSPQQIIFSSIFYIMSVLGGISLGLVLQKICSMSLENRAKNIVAIASVIFIILLLVTSHFDIDNIFLTNAYVTFLVFIISVRNVLLLKYVETDKKFERYGKLISILSKPAKTILITMGVVALIITQILTTKTMSEKILLERENTLPLVKLTGDMTKWYLIEATHEKALLIKEKSKNEKKEIFKMTEIENIEKIISIDK